jgi:Type III restriction enzyme, res subunit
MTINYLDAPSGAGKTYLLQEKVAKLVKSGDSVIFCQPTKLLIDETASAMRSRFPTIEQKVIHGKNGEPVVGSIINHLKDSQKYVGPHVLFITYEAFQRLKFIPSKDLWHLIIDEIPQVYDCFDEHLKVSHGLITKYMEQRNLDDSRYSLLQVTDEGRIRAIAENKSEDKALGLFQKLASRLASPHWENYVLSDGYKRLLSSKDESGK